MTAAHVQVDPGRAAAPSRGGGGLRTMVALAGGGLLAVAFPAVDWSPLAWLALVPLLWPALGRGPAAALRIGWLYGFAFFLATLYWIVLPISGYTSLAPVVSVGPVLLLCAFLALFPAMFAVGCEAARARAIPLPLVAPSLWVVLEWARTYVLGGFPWVGLGYSQYRTTYLIQFVEFTGVYGVSALVVLVNVVVFGAFRRWWDGRVPRTGGLLLVTVLLLVLVSWGYWRVRELERLPVVGEAMVGVIQGNIPQDVKWDPAYQIGTLEQYERLTALAAAEGATLVIWPEAAVPFFFQSESELRDRVLALASRLGIWLVFGSPGFDDGGPELALSNRAYVVSPAGDACQYYDKMELVPFGEYVPFARLLSFVHKIVEGVGEFRPGREPVVLRTAPGDFGVLICYEGIFPGLTRKFVAGGARFLVNITNDAWFGRTSAPYQHLAMGTLRAVENRVPMVRVANTGFSAMVDVDGTIRWRTELFETAWRVDTIRWVEAPTFYTRRGDLFVYACMVILIVAFLGRPRRPTVSMVGRQIT